MLDLVVRWQFRFSTDQDSFSSPDAEIQLWDQGSVGQTSPLLISRRRFQIPDSEGSDVDGADEALLAAGLDLHHPAHAHHRVDVVQAHLQGEQIYFWIFICVFALHNLKFRF